MTNEWTTKEDTPKLFFGALQPPDSEIEEFESSDSSSVNDESNFDTMERRLKNTPAH